MSDQTREMPFGEVGDRARFWHPLVNVSGSFFAFYFWAVLTVVVVASMDAAAGKSDPFAADTLLVRYGLGIMGLSFALTLLHFLFWTRVVERRPLTSIGLFRGGSLRLYVNGLVYGVLFATIVSLAAFIAALYFGLSMPATLPATRDITQPDVLFAAMIVPIALIQGGTEEVICRGWMLSALSARMSITLAVLTSSVAFGLFHLDRFFLDTHFAIVFISGTIVLGAFLGVWAVQSGSVAGPAGFHGAYNALSFVVSYLDQAATSDPAATPAQVWNTMMNPETMQETVRYVPYIAALETAVVACSLIGIVALLVTKPARRDHKEA